MKSIRALVVEDSLTVRKRIVEVLESDPDITVIGEAADGKTAIELCLSLRPDVVTLDMMLPVMTGVAATEYIMAYCPTPVLIVSASTNRGELFRTYDALAAGAVEVLEKPLGDETDDRWERTLISTVKLVSRIKVITHLRGRLRGAAQEPASISVCHPGAAPYRMVAIGTSTGGPGACLEILKSLPPDFPLPILLVIHIGEAFGAALADWLDSQSGLRVACARDGEALPAVGEARVLLAPPGRHMVLRNGRIRLIDSEERHSCRPSVDVLFESVAEGIGDRAIGCLLTGMGKDGAQGLLAMRRAGAWTAAQDEASSVVFGMPHEAIAVGAAERVLPLSQIAPALLALAGAMEGKPA
jgi:two-component system, chemotaxis family, protein-glutamate methylesterase/glutaminase